MGNLGNWLNLSNGNIANELVAFCNCNSSAVTRSCISFVRIWKSDFFTKSVCNTLPNMRFEFSIEKSVFWLLKVEPYAHKLQLLQHFCIAVLAAFHFFFTHPRRPHFFLFLFVGVLRLSIWIFMKKKCVN